MPDITIERRNLREVFNYKTYHLDYYQRGYAWKETQVFDLLEDLTKKFDKGYASNPSRIEDYGIYYLGTYISDTSNYGKRYIVDGQQRLTTLTLLFIYLYRIEANPDLSLKEFIYHYDSSTGKKEYIFQVEERESVFKLLLEADKSFQVKPKENNRLLVNYGSIVKFFEDKKYSSTELEWFANWLTSQVKMAEIDAGEDAYNVFITMNERGADLVAEDLLKGHVFSHITKSKQPEMSELWDKATKRIDDYRDYNLGASSRRNTESKTSVSQFVIDWISSKYARDSKDIANIAAFGKGKGFHKWIMDNNGLLNLSSSTSYEQLVTEMEWFSRQYIRILSARSQIVPGLEKVLYASSYPLAHFNKILLANLEVDDSIARVQQKINFSSTLVDSWVGSHIWQNRDLEAHPTREQAQQLIIALRVKDGGIKALKVAKELIDFEGSAIQLPQRSERKAPATRKKMKYLLSRLTDKVEQIQNPTSTGTHFSDYIKNNYHVEHIIAQSSKNNPYPQEDLEREERFGFLKQRLGNLVLLRGKENSSENDNSYEKKLATYSSNNKLAGSLNLSNYKENMVLRAWTDLRRYNETLESKMKGYSSFGINEVIERESLYREIAKTIWELDNVENDGEA